MQFLYVLILPSITSSQPLFKDELLDAYDLYFVKGSTAAVIGSSRIPILEEKINGKRLIDRLQIASHIPLP